MSLALETHYDGSVLVLSCDALYRYTCLTVVAFSSFDRGRDVFFSAAVFKSDPLPATLKGRHVRYRTGDTPFLPLRMNELSEDGLLGMGRN